MSRDSISIKLARLESTAFSQFRVVGIC